jgi:hypothetical protein
MKERTGIAYAKLVFPVFLFLWVVTTVNAQQAPHKSTVVDSLDNKISLYGAKNQSPVLFVHFDKTIYSNNEDVWFTAYLLRVADYEPHKVLSVALIKDDDRFVVLESKYMIKDGLALGSAVIPNSAVPGNYSFMVSTNRLLNGKPEVIFTQPVTIKAIEQQNYTALLSPIDTSVTALQQKVLLQVNFASPQPPKEKTPREAVINYYVGNSAHPVIKGFAKTQGNQYVLNIPSKLISEGNNALHVQVEYKSEVKQLSMILAVSPKAAVVRFYPEGGNLVNNIQSTIGWEIKNAAGAPLGVNAILYRDEKIIDTLKTGSDGLGRFMLRPIVGSNYYLKLYGINKQDTAYKLPVAITQGPAITLPNALVNDTLIVNLHDNQQQKLYLVGHNYKQLFFTTVVNMNVPNKRIKLIVKDIPKGLTQLTITDSLGRPFAERVFFAHYDQRTPTTVLTDKDAYTTRQQVNVKLKLDDGKPDTGYVSVACVQENRIELKKSNDIESYFYLKSELEDIPIRESYLSNTEANRLALENVLLIKGWRRYTWTDVLKAKPSDTARNYTGVVFKGSVTHTNSTLTRPVEIMSVGNPLNQIVTDKTGHFVLANADLLADSGKKASFIVKGPIPKEYEFHFVDPYTSVNERLAGQLQPNDYTTKGQENSKYMEVPFNERAIRLKQVDIKGNKNDSFYGRSGADKSNVRVFSITVVIKGVTFVNKYETNVASTNVLQLNGIYKAQEFYPVDVSKDITEPQYLSTLYWKHLVQVSSIKDTDISFNTGDITGRFKLIVQGITNNDVTYGETSFNVTKPK